MILMRLSGVGPVRSPPHIGAHTKCIIIICSNSGKTGFQIYRDTNYSRDGVNQIWILKNSKDLLKYIQSMSSPRAITLNHLISLFFTVIPHS